MSTAIYKLDASALVLSACLLRLRRVVVDGYREPLTYNDTQYGSAFHRFEAVLAETSGNIGLATHAATDLFNRTCKVREGKKHLNEQHLVKTCMDAWEYYKKNDNSEILSINGKPLVEVDFDIEVYRDDDTVVYLVGTIDKLVKIKNGCYAIGDYKTHSLWKINASTPQSFIDHEVRGFFRKFALSTQLRFYLYCLLRKAEMHPEHELSKILLGSPIGTFIDGVFISKDRDTIFQRSDVMFPFEDKKALASFHKLVMNKVFQLVSIVKTNYQEMDGVAQGACFEQQYACQFVDVCACGNNEIRKLLFERDFVKRDYDPLTFSK